MYKLTRQFVQYFAQHLGYYVLCILCGIMLFILSCNTESKICTDNSATTFNIHEDFRNLDVQQTAHTVILNGCEYMYTGGNTAHQTMFHKGNCKFFMQRTKN